MPARDALKRYRGKRVAGGTPEPGVTRGARRGKDPARPGARRYVIQLHYARRRHYDFRLEFDGVLKSWAVPKGPSRDPAVKRLAVEVEDHPVDYGGFEGSIPEGHYGAGEVHIWDEGRWRPEGDAKAVRAALKKGHLDFTLEGVRLTGHWSLIRTHLAAKQPQWLLIKQKDEAARVGDAADETPLSARPAVSAPSRAKGARVSASGGKRAPFPKSIGLPLARLVERAPEGEAWRHEIKFDGYRVLIFRNGARVRIDSRNGVDYTAKLPALVEAVRALPVKTCVLDAELVALDAQGRSRFGLLQQRMGEGGEIVAMVFDAPYLDGRDLCELTLSARQNAMQALRLGGDGLLRAVEHHTGEGAALFGASCREGLEGLICKRADSPYREGRLGDWLKLKCVDSGEFVVVGFTPGKGARAALGSLLLALPGRTAREPWRYVGRVGSGLDERRLEWFAKHLKAARRPAPLDEPPTRAQLLGAVPRWVEPKVVVEVEHRGWTEDRRLRQAAFKTVREDRSLAQLRREELPMKVEAMETQSAPRAGTSRTRVAAKKKPRASKPNSEVRFTHPERELFIDPVVTKAEIGGYYRDIAELVLPEIVGRPLSMLRCPDGVGGTCFFQKHLTPGFGGSVHERRAKRGEKLPYIDDLDGLLGLVQMNVLELHPWGSRLDDVEHPDRVVFDLDPAPDVKWKAVVGAARQLRERLQALELESFVRTSGGKGLHVVLPLTGGDDWGSVKAFAHAVAASLAQESPERFVDVATKAKRGGRIFVDYLRNTRGATSVASYSLRARKGAPIATPLAWDELGRIRSGAQFHFGNLRRRLDKVGDAWAGLAKVHQQLPAHH